MSRPSLAFAVVCLASLAPTQNSTAQVSRVSSTSPVQVVYVVENDAILTYDVDPQTLNATQVGTLKVHSSNNGNFWLQTSPNGHFVYFITYDAQLNQHLYVYQTDANGAPQAPATQAMKVNTLWSLQFDPHADFAYAVIAYPYTGFESTFTILRYLVDPATGRLSQPEIQATYQLWTDSSGEDCGVGVIGFNAAGTMLYDEVGCNNRDTEGGTYYERTLNPKTGALGPDVQLSNWLLSGGGWVSTQFIGGLMYDLVSPNDFQQGINYVDIYPRVPNTNQPLLHCTAQMLEACGYATGRVHPSGKYLFMQISPGTYQIDKVELSQKKIVDTGNYLLVEWFNLFSPDGSLVYGEGTWSGSGFPLNIFGFDVKTSAVTPGGSIWIQGLGTPYAAERY